MPGRGRPSVARAVERARRSTGCSRNRTAWRCRRGRGRRLVGLPALGEDLLPGRVDVAATKSTNFAARRPVPCPDRSRAPGAGSNCPARVDPEPAAPAAGSPPEEVDDEQDDQADAAAARLPDRERDAAATEATAASAAILDPACTSTSAPLHSALIPLGWILLPRRTLSAWPRRPHCRVASSCRSSLACPGSARSTRSRSRSGPPRSRNARSRGTRSFRRSSSPSG